MIDELHDRLAGPEWESIVSAGELSFADWIRLARVIRAGQGERKTQLIARIQCLLIAAGICSDDDFVNAISRVDSDFDAFCYTLADAQAWADGVGYEAFKAYKEGRQV